MNNKELIEKYELELKDVQLKFGSSFKTKVYKELLDDLKQLDEPQKVTVPQFVADWIEEGKKHCKDVSDLFDFDFTNEEVGKWFLQEKPFDLVARAWLDGYTVEEKRYLVKMKGMVEGFMVLKLDKFRDGWYLGNDTEYSYTKAKHTRKELEEAGFGWVFDCPGVEIEEVEE